MRRRLVALTIFAVLLSPTADARASWSPLRTAGPAPSARFDHALAGSGRSVVLFGGQRDGRALGDLWRLDAGRRRWTRLRPRGLRPAARFGHNLLAEPDGSLLLFGGQAGSRFLADVWRYSPGRGAWTRLAPGAGPSARYGAGAAIDPATGTTWVTHGFTTAGRFDDTWALGGDRFADVSGLGARPLERCLLHGAFAAGGLFLFAGQSDPDSHREDLWRYDAATRRWRELEPARRPGERNRYAAAQTRTAWFIHGGDGPRGERADLWRYDFASGTFRRLRGRAPGARSGHALAVAGRRLVLFGGARGGRELSDAWVRRLG